MSDAGTKEVLAVLCKLDWLPYFVNRRHHRGCLNANPGEMHFQVLDLSHVTFRSGHCPQITQAVFVYNAYKI
jgi:hypothetical protein